MALKTMNYIRLMKCYPLTYESTNNKHLKKSRQQYRNQADALVLLEGNNQQVAEFFRMKGKLEGIECSHNLDKLLNELKELL